MSPQRPGVGVGVFIWKDNKFLMGRRIGKHGNDTWSVPGGWLEYGESFAECAKRETVEETGVTIKNIKLMTVTNNNFQNEQQHSITVFMSSEWESGSPHTIELEKFVDVGWFTFETLPKELFLPLIELKALGSHFFIPPQPS